MKKLIKILSVFFILFILILVYDFLNNKHYKEKFEQTKTNSHLKEVVQNWGNPDREFIYKELDNSIIYKYKKDLMGWDTYIFVFNPKDSILVSKNIDD